MKRTFYLCCFSVFLRYKKNRILELGTLALLSEIAKNAIIAGCFGQPFPVSIVGVKTIHAKAAQLVTASVYYMASTTCRCITCPGSCPRRVGASPTPTIVNLTRCIPRGRRWLRDARL